jgi:hypothetical protein
MQMKAAILVLVMAAAPVRADDEPWAVGVTAEQKATAKTRLDDGNARFLAQDYAGALERYRDALRAWDHPAIRFNIVRCLIRLDRPVEASDELALALKYGAAPLAQTVYDEALSYQKLLANQIGELDVHCTQPGVAVTLDGQPLLRCPGDAHRRVSPNRHQIVGSAAGMLTQTMDVDVFGGKHADATVTLVPLAKASKEVHRWPIWKPWIVFGSGLALAAVGGVFRLQATSEMSAYDRQVARDCAVVGCTPSQLDTKLRSRAQLDNAIAISAMATGAAAALTGGVLLYMNRGEIVYADARVTLAPRADGAVVTLSFEIGR